MADRIREARSGTGLSQAEAGRQLGVTRSGVSQWENGHTYPSVRHLAAMAELYDVSSEWLATGREDGPRREVREGLRLTARERELVERYRAAGADRRRLVLEMLKAD